MRRITRDFSLIEKVCVFAAILLLGLPMLAAGQEKGQGFGEDSEGTDLVTMPGMRSMVPSLVGLGWDNFFLNNRFGLSSDQIQKLLSIREAFVIENRLAEQAAREAELLLYEELGRDQVSSRRLEDRIDSRATLQGKVLSLRFRYLLRAINILNHEQHQKIVAFLKSGVPPISERQSRQHSELYVVPLRLATLKSAKSRADLLPVIGYWLCVLRQDYALSSAQEFDAHPGKIVVFNSKVCSSSSY